MVCGSTFYFLFKIKNKNSYTQKQRFNLYSYFFKKKI